MAKKAGKSETPGGGKQINFRAPQDLAERLDYVAAGLGLDVSNLVRMALYESLHIYEKRVEDIKKGVRKE